MAEERQGGTSLRDVIVAAIVSALIGAVATPFVAYIGSTSLFSPSSRMFFTEIQNHNPVNGEYTSIITIINSSNHAYDKIRISINSLDNPGKSRIEDCFFDIDAHVADVNLPDCRSVKMSGQRFGFSIDALPEFSKFSTIIKSENQFEVGDLEENSRGIRGVILFDSKNIKIVPKKLDRYHIYPYTPLQYTMIFSLFSLIFFALFILYLRFKKMRTETAEHGTENG